MFEIATSIGIFSYIIFFLGISGVLFPKLIICLSFAYWGIFVWWKRSECKKYLSGLTYLLFKQRSPLFFFIFLLLTLQVVINFVGVLGPELGFDALWYHLTLPKLFLEWHQIRHIPGGLLYYSDMPKLTEMLYIPGLIFLQETGAKFIHFLLGILCCVALYKLGRKFFPPVLSLMTVAIFYSNLVVGWESMSAYIDLGRTFFSIVTLVGIFQWIETRKTKWLVASAVSLGFGIATKFIAVLDLCVFIPIIMYIDWKSKNEFLQNILQFALWSLVIPLPWWIYSYVQTSNPFYPFFTPIYPTVTSLNLNPLSLVSTVWNEFTHSADPVSPMYIAFLPFLFLVKKWDKKLITLLFIGILSIVVWYVSPQTGGGRFLLPYLPVFSLLVVLVFKNLKSRVAQLIFIGFLLISLVTSIGYRSIANAKFVPVIFGKETKTEFLTKHLNFLFGDWYDIDGYMAKRIKPTDTVLLYGYHNLYYVDFPYIHESWVKKGDKFDFIATDGNVLPVRFKNWHLVYQNSATHLHLYSDEGRIWIY